MSIFDHLLHQAEGKLSGIASGAEHAVQSAEQAATAGVKSAEQAAVKELSSVASTGVSQIEQAAKIVEQDLSQAVHTVLSSAVSAAIEKGLKEAVKVLEEWGPQVVSEINITLGPLSFTVGDIPRNFKKLQNAVQNPPKHLSDIIGLVEEIAPPSVTLQFGFDISFVVIDVSALSVSGGIVVPTKHFLDQARIHLAGGGL